MGFKKCKSQVQKLEEAVVVMRAALENYSNDENWTDGHGHDCYDCHCPRYRTLFLGRDYRDGCDIAQEALEEVNIILNEVWE